MTPKCIYIYTFTSRDGEPPSTLSPGCRLGCDTDTEYSGRITFLQVQGLDSGGMGVDVLLVLPQQLFVVVAFPREGMVVGHCFLPFVRALGLCYLPTISAFCQSPFGVQCCQDCPSGLLSAQVSSWLWEGAGGQQGQCRTAASLYLSALAVVDIAAIATSVLWARSHCSVGSRLCPRNNRAEVRIFTPCNGFWFVGLGHGLWLCMTEGSSILPMPRMWGTQGASLL